LAGELVEGLVCAVDTNKSIVELGCSAASNLKVKTFGDGEPIPA